MAPPAAKQVPLNGRIRIGIMSHNVTVAVEYVQPVISMKTADFRTANDKHRRCLAVECYRRALQTTCVYCVFLAFESQQLVRSSATMFRINAFELQRWTTVTWSFDQSHCHCSVVDRMIIFCDLSLTTYITCFMFSFHLLSILINTAHKWWFLFGSCVFEGL